MVSMQVDIGGNDKTCLYLKCNYYDKLVERGVIRMKEHFSGLQKNAISCA